MSEEFKDFTTAPTPTLTLEPTLDTQEPLVTGGNKTSTSFRGRCTF